MNDDSPPPIDPDATVPDSPGDSTPDPLDRLLGVDFGDLPSVDEGPPLSEGPGDWIGRYKLLQKIGEGGMGEVWMAEQREPVERKVALKIIKAGMDTKEVIARFEAERQALAVMDHTNIAHVLDGGATRSGRPYFVMELVHGKAVTEYCDQAKLDMRARLELFSKICDAVAHAHQKGIIHRDLKPSNIMVTKQNGRPVPKVIDFGIAKATAQRLTEKTLFTQYGQMIGTPAYMSPEQAEFSDEDTDTRSDIYSLGVLLYELLTGQTPFVAERLRSAGYDEMRRIIREEEPPKPSTRIGILEEVERKTTADLRKVEVGHFGHTVRGDLDWIVMKALDKQRDRRYETANGLALDIGRFLADEPVSAGPPTVRYLVSKYIRRHRVAATSIATITVTLIVAATFSTWQAVVAIKARDIAEEERRKSERSLLMIGDAHQGATDLAVDLILELRNARPDDPRPIAEQAQEIVELFYQESEPPGADEDSRHLRAVVLDSRGYLARRLGEFATARQWYEKGRKIREELLRLSPDRALYLHNLAVSFDNLGDLHVERSKLAENAVPHYDDALADYRRGLGFAKQLDGLPDAVPYWRHDVAVSYYKIGSVLFAKLGPGEAEKAFLKGYAITKELMADDSDYPKWQRLHARFCLQLGLYYWADGDSDQEAIQFFEEGKNVVLGMPEPLSKKDAELLGTLTRELAEAKGEGSE